MNRFLSNCQKMNLRSLQSNIRLVRGGYNAERDTNEYLVDRIHELEE